MSITDRDLVTGLFDSETALNGALLEVLAMVKPKKASQSTFTAIVRGLFTKNARLLTIVSEALDKFSFSPELHRETFKNLVNDFILWCDDNAASLLHKYLSQLDNRAEDPRYRNPAANCSNYINFAQNATHHIRNPFVVERLNQISKDFQSVLDQLDSVQEDAHLNSIEFDKVTLIHTPTVNPVSSFFDPSQIVHRLQNKRLFLKSRDPKSSRSRYPVEMVCLNLNSTQLGEGFDALALLLKGVSNNSALLLMFPPFRVNEFSISFDEALNELRLTMLDFSENHTSKSIVIGGEDPLQLWYNRLLSIFPYEDDNPVLISRSNGSLQLLGLGINVLQEFSLEESSSMEDTTSETTSFHDLIDSPSLSGLTDGLKINTAERSLDLYLELPPSSNSNYNSSGTKVAQPLKYLPISSLSNKSRTPTEVHSKRYEHMVNKIKKNLTVDSQLSSIHKDLASYVEPDEERPVSCTAEVVECSPLDVKRPESNASKDVIDISAVSVPPLTEHKAPYNNTFASQSVPELKISHEVAPKPMYEQNALSAIDLSNFGRSHQPSFSVHKDLCEMINEPEKKRGLFGLFKRKKKPQQVENPSTTPKQIAIRKEEENMDRIRQEMYQKEELNKQAKLKQDKIKQDKIKQEKIKQEQMESLAASGFELKEKGTLKNDLATEYLDFKPPNILNDSANRSSESLVLTASSIASNKSGSAFALPNSTSMYFFKQNSGDADQEAITIPQDLKHQINKETSLDFYILPACPIKVSKWKQKYGKWEMLSTSENIFLKIVNNYELEKSWLLVFKEEIVTNNEGQDEEIDIPILLLTLMAGKTKGHISGALDYVLNLLNSITKERQQIMFRFNKKSYLKEFSNNIENVMGALSVLLPLKPRSFNLAGTINLSLMENTVISSLTILSISTAPINGPLASESKSLAARRGLAGPATLTSPSSGIMKKSTTAGTIGTLATISSDATQQSFPKPSQSLYNLVGLDSSSLSLVNGPDCQRLPLLNNMRIRLQKNMEGYEQIHNPLLWKIMSMNNLSVCLIHNDRTGVAFYNLMVEGEENFSWYINTEDRFDVIERIGKAGMVFKIAEDEIYMIECKGKKELKVLCDLF